MAYTIEVTDSEDNMHIREGDNSDAYSNYILYAGSKDDDMYKQWDSWKDNDDWLDIIPTGLTRVFMKATGVSNGNVELCDRPGHYSMKASLHATNTYDENISVSKQQAIVCRHSY